MGCAAGPDLAGSLDRHQHRLKAGLPTVSVLLGPVGLAVETAGRWADARGRPVALVNDPNLGALVEARVDCLTIRSDLPMGAAAWLARRLDRPAAEFASWIVRKTPLELSVFLDATLPGVPGDFAEAACRWLLERSAVGALPASPGLVAELREVLSGRDVEIPCEQVAAILRELAAPKTDPVLIAARGTNAPDAAVWIERAAASLARLAGTGSGLTLILAVEPETLDAFQRQGSESRAKAVLRSGVIEVPSLDGTAVERRLEAEVPGLTATLAGSIRRLALNGASEQLIGRFLDAARADSDAATSPETTDRARSAAERFLSERLASLPETSGLFALNARLDVPFGLSRSMEVDLVCKPLQLVVEIDGYHHFQDADAYRRDRRKDQALQQQGYMVVRVLADDVVRRLEDVLDQILSAVASRRGRAQSQRGMNP